MTFRRVVTLRWLPFLILSLMALGGSVIAVDGVEIIGECNYDADANQTVCKYTIYGELIYGLTVFFPIPPTCVECVEIKSEAMSFVGPQQWEDTYGFRSIEFDLQPGREVTFLVTYDGQKYDGNQFQTAHIEYEGEILREFDIPAMEVCTWEPLCEFAFDATEANWMMRKSGTYAGEWANATLKSNVDMSVQFGGFQILIDEDGDELAIWHAIGDVGDPNPPQNWLTPDEFNFQTLSIDAGDDITQFSLWTRVQTTDATSVGKYVDEATITLVLDNNQPYVDLGIESQAQERREPNKVRLGERRIIR